MELFSGDKEVIKKDILELTDAVNHSRNSSESMHIYNLLQTLSYFYSFFDEKGYDYFKKSTYNFKDFVSKQDAIFSSKLKRANKNYIENKLFHQEFIDSLMDGKTIEYPTSLLAITNDYDFNDKEMYDILTSFLNSYNRGSNKLLDQLIEEKRIHKTSLYGDTRGITISNYYLENYHVFISDEDNLESLIALVHEFGHVVDSNNLLHSFPKKVAYNYFIKSSFLETISSLYEKDFCDFLIKEKIYPNATREYLVDYYHSMYTMFDYAEITASLPDNLLKNQKYRCISKEKLIEKLYETNYYVNEEDMPYPSELEMYSDIEYGYGKFLATYFSYLKKHDTTKFSEQFDRFLNIRGDYFRPDFLEYIGTNRNDAIKIVEEEINSSTSKVIVKKTI